MLGTSQQLAKRNLKMNTATNFIKFDSDNIENSAGSGRISTLTNDLTIKVMPINNPKSDKTPTHRIYSKSPAGFDIQVGGIWKNKSQQGKEYFSITLKAIDFRANLGRYPEQDDESLQAIIEWD